MKRKSTKTGGVPRPRPDLTPGELAQYSGELLDAIEELSFGQRRAVLRAALVLNEEDAPTVATLLSGIPK